MAMSGTRLKGNLATDILSQLQSAFPIPSTLQTAEKTAMATQQSNLATALANACGPDIVTEVQNATVTVASVSGVTSGSGNSGPGTGTVT